ncbi:hypothetical protein GCM10009780_79620 [Actinomadura alba]
MFLVGDSAGGHIATNIGTHRRANIRYRGVVGFSPSRIHGTVGLWSSNRWDAGAAGCNPPTRWTTTAPVPPLREDRGRSAVRHTRLSIFQRGYRPPYRDTREEPTMGGRHAGDPKDKPYEPPKDPPSKDTPPPGGGTRGK